MNDNNQQNIKNNAAAAAINTIRLLKLISLCLNIPVLIFSIRRLFSYSD